MDSIGRRAFLKGSAAAAIITLPAGLAIEGCSTSWLETALNDLPILAQMATSIIAIIADATGNGALDTATAALITEAVKEASAAIVAAQAVVAAYQQSAATTPVAKVLAALQAVSTNLTNILSVAKVKDPVTQTTIAGAVGAAIILVEAIEALLPASVSTGAAMARVKLVTTRVEMPKPGAIKFLFNVHLVINGYPQHQIS